MSKSQNTTTDYAPMMETISQYAGGKGTPTWKRVGVDKATVSAFLSESDPAEVVEQWKTHTGALSKLPATLLTDAIMAAIISAESVETMASLKVAFMAAQSGQESDSGDKLTDNCTSAGKLAGERIATLRAALVVLESSEPYQVSAAGSDRVAAYVSARDAAASKLPQLADVAKVVGTVVNGNTTLAETYGKGGDFVSCLMTEPMPPVEIN